MKYSILPLFLFFAVSGAAHAADDVIRIGVLNDESGVYSDGSGIGSVIAAKLAVEDTVAIPGIKVEVINADHQNKPEVAVSIAKKWFSEDKVDAIADLGPSSIALALSQLAREQNKVVLPSSTMTADLTGKACSPNTVHWTEDTWAVTKPLAKLLVDQGLKTWYFVTVDYTYGYDLEKNAADTVTAEGGKVLGSVRHPLGVLDFSSYVLQADASGAKVIALADGGDDATHALTQVREFGITDRHSLVGLNLNTNTIKTVGLPTAQGIFFVSAFYWDMDDATRAFSKRWAALRGNNGQPSDMQAGVYGAVLHYLKAIRQLGPGLGHDGAKVVATMKQIPIDDPLMGKGTIRPDGRAVHDMLLLQAKTPQESKATWDLAKLYARIPGEDAFRPMSEGGCPLVAAK